MKYWAILTIVFGVTRVGCTEDADIDYSQLLSKHMITISSGKFIMGCNKNIDRRCGDDEYFYHEVNNEYSYHEVIVPEFKIDLTEVLVFEYRICTSCSEPGTGEQCNWNRPDREDHPVNCINWNQAKEYCEWAGKRLCTEAEWEKAARGTDGRIYPWGNEEADCNFAVLKDSRGSGCGEFSTLPWGSKPSGIYGLYDMSGNVYEWVEDYYHENYNGAPLDGSAWSDDSNISVRVNRGGGFGVESEFLRASGRYFSRQNYAGSFIGVRCCKDIP